MSESHLHIEADRAALLIVDIQERLAAAMPAQERERAERNVAILVDMARRFDIPVVASEQYPRGLGRTVPGVRAALDSLDGAAHELEKVEFSVCAAPAFAPIDEQLGRDQWIVTGMEAHVCVYQTVRELRARGLSVHVPTDAVVSRTAANRDIGIRLMDRAGAVMTSTEVVVFDVLQRAGSDDFKALSKLIR